VILAGELLKRANDLVRNKIHPTSIIAGYRLAMRESGEVHRGQAVDADRRRSVRRPS
jgi:chaperonin GroEL (HSP60 family)